MLENSSSIRPPHPRIILPKPLKPNPKPSPACPTLLRRLRLHWSRKKKQTIEREQLVTRRRLSLQVGCDFLNLFLIRIPPFLIDIYVYWSVVKRAPANYKGGFCRDAFKSDRSVWNHRGYVVFILSSCVYQFLDQRCICFFLIMLVIHKLPDPCPGRMPLSMRPVTLQRVARTM